MTREEKKAEAVNRMKALKLSENVIREFLDEDKLNLSENGGFLYWLDESQQKIVNEFEKEYNAVVYHIIHSFTEFGELLSMLYVSDYEEEWENDNNDIRDGYALSYVKNLTDDFCSEFGSIGVKPSIGGLIRTA